MTVESGATTEVADLFLPPTLSLDKTVVRVGDSLLATGTTVPRADVTILVRDGEDRSFETVSDAHGRYAFIIDTTSLPKGDYEVSTSATVASQTSPFGASVPVTVGEQTVLAPTPPSDGWLDPNNDGKTDLVDFSILAYWYGRPLSGDMLQYEAIYLSGDGIIDLIDFSILIYHWTG